MKKVGKIGISICMLLIWSKQPELVYAQDFSGQEEYYEEYCSSPRSSAEEAQVCANFKDYMSSKTDDISGKIDELNGQIASIQNDIDAVVKQIDQYNVIIKELDQSIANYQASIDQIQASLTILANDIIQTEQDIKERDDLIKSRMLEEQPSVGINAYIEVVMGSKDILDLIRMVDGIQTITENDQREIEKLNDDKRKLELQKQEQERLKQEVVDKQEKIKEQKVLQEATKSEQEKLANEYKKVEAQLLQEKRSQQTKADAIQSAIININTSVAGSVPEVPSNTGGWISPIGFSIGEGTFRYSVGGFHAGVDFPTNDQVGFPVVAPINGVIVYSANPIGTTTTGMIGFPAGGGNTVHMIGQVNGTTYAMSFFHLAQENWVSSPGQVVNQGQVIAYSGHSGNSTGPHLHFEVINLGSMSMEQAIAQFQNTLDFAWGTGWYSDSTACINNGYSIPCRERPETLLY